MSEKNTLKDIMDEQRDFQKNFFNPDDISEEDKIKFTKENILSLHRELGEVLNEIPWKTHRANVPDYNLNNIHEELIDCFKFLLNVCIIWGMNTEILYNTFMMKSAIVRQRYLNEKDSIK